MERNHREALRELNARCKDLTRKIRNLPDETVECEQSFDMDSQKLDKIRFELIAAHHKVLPEALPHRLALDNEFADSIRETSLSKEIEDMKIVCEMQRQYITHKEKDTELNKETRECFHEILEAIEDKDDVEVERSQTKRKLVEAKSQTRYILEKFYPEYQSELLAIFEKLEKSYAKEDEEEQWLDLGEHNITCILLLKQAMIIEQHKSELTCFRFAPLI